MMSFTSVLGRLKMMHITHHIEVESHNFWTNVILNEGIDLEGASGDKLILRRRHVRAQACENHG